MYVYQLCQSRRFNLPHLHLVPPLEVIRFKFCQVLWHQKMSPWAMVWHCLHDSMFSHFETIPVCDRWLDGHMTTACVDGFKMMPLIPKNR